MEGAGVWGHTGNSIKAVRAFLRNLCTLSLDPPTPWVIVIGVRLLGGNVLSKSANAAWYYKKQTTPHNKEASGKAERIRAFVILNLQQAAAGVVSISKDTNDLSDALNGCFEGDISQCKTGKQ